MTIGRKINKPVKGIYIFLILLFTAIYFISLWSGSKNRIDSLLEKDDAYHLVQAYHLIGEDKDTSYIKLIFINPYDPRTSNHFKFKGMSIYQQKMWALKQMSGLIPPHKITSDVDSSIVDYYRNWAIKNGYLR